MTSPVRSSRSLALTLTLCALTFFPALAQTIGPPDPSGGGAMSAQLQNQATAGSGSCQKLVATSRLRRSASFSQADGDLDVFNPSGPRDMQATIANLSAASVRVEIQRDGSRGPDFETIAPGTTLTREYLKVLDVILRCEDPTGATCRVELDLLHAPPSGNGHAADLPLWYPGPVAQGNADLPPDQNIDCLWEEDLIWSSAQGRKMELLVEITGDQDLSIEVEDSNNTFDVYNRSAPPSPPVNQTLHAFFDDAIAVRVKCNKNPINGCSNCKYHYSVTILP